MGNMYSVLMIGVIALITIILRFLPFILFRKGKTPGYIISLGRVLPYAIMGMLVIFCLKNVSILQTPFALPEFISCGVVILLHLWKRKTLISIIGGTACYMYLVQVIF
ncbi:branched-chain amino acid transporter permease [Alloiococcus sp. CFN-8]|uniref:branched-chain amino acid transporter permease n=1 Tax=Alloiococcus sp. CFN-8 TaxID=3416081 RepID=UPI003CEF6271